MAISKHSKRNKETYQNFASRKSFWFFCIDNFLEAVIIKLGFIKNSGVTRTIASWCSLKKQNKKRKKKLFVWLFQLWTQKRPFLTNLLFRTTAKTFNIFMHHCVCICFSPLLLQFLLFLFKFSVPIRLYSPLIKRCSKFMTAGCHFDFYLQSQPILFFT